MSATLHPAERYARDVIANRIPACHWVKQACKRYFDDKKNAKAKGLYFDRAAAQLAIDLFTETNIPQGEFSGQPFDPQNWTLFGLWNMYGWRRDKHPRWKIENYNGEIEDTSGTRRFREAYYEVARKNIKTSFGAVNGIKLAFADGVHGAEVYSAAMKKDQARICFDHAKEIIEISPFLREEGGIEALRNNLSQVHTYSKFEPLSADTKSMDGLRVHGAILDEVHAWKSRDTYVKLKRATSADREPLIIMITTAGKTEESQFCWELHEYSCKVLDGIVEDDTFFALIYTLDEKDDWTDETNWIKANPYLGLSKKTDYMRTEAQRAKDMPTALNDFLQFELSQWVRSTTKWMPMEHWRLNAGPVPASRMEAFLAARPNRACYAGLDLASVSDLTALVLEFPPIPEDPLHYILPFFFVPEDGIMKRARNDRVPYDLWADQGYLIPTPGNITDQEFIMQRLSSLMQIFDLKRLYFDRHGSTKIVADLQNELNFTVDVGDHEQNGRPLLVQFGQGWVSMSPPMNDVMRVTLLHQFAHGDHPVLNWNMDNLIAKVSNTGSISPDKQKSREKIDGGVALIMSHAGTMIHTETSGFKSVYEERGVLTL